MGQIRVVVDLPGEKLLKSLGKQPIVGYNSSKLKSIVEARLKETFKDATSIKVEVIEHNIFFGIDVMGEDLEEVADAQKRVSAAVKDLMEKLKR